MSQVDRIEILSFSGNILCLVVSIEQNYISSSICNYTYVSHCLDDLKGFTGKWKYVNDIHFDDYMKEIVRKFFCFENLLSLFLYNRVLVFVFFPFEQSVIRFMNSKWIHTMHDENGKESKLMRWVTRDHKQIMVRLSGYILIPYISFTLT